MNKLRYFITTLFLAAALGSYAQTESPTGTAEANHAIYKNKLKRSQDQLTNEKKTSNPKWWLSRAELMRDIFNLHREFLQQGRDEVHVKLFYPNPKDTREWQDEEGNMYKELEFDLVTITMKNGQVEKWEEKNVLYEDPLPEALRSLEKAQKLDEDGKLDKKIKEQYDLLKRDFERLAIEYFFEPDYQASYRSFSRIDSINQKAIMEGAVDTTLLYYTGMAASRGGMPEEAIKYYKKAIENDYPEPDIYVFLKQKYFEVGDTAKGVEALETGFKKFPDNQAVLIELINHYLLAGKGEAALEYLKIAQSDDPENISFIFAEATLYDKMGDTEKALETYKRAIEIDPDYFNAYYNMGVMYYNKAVEMYKEAETIKTPKEYGEAKDAGDEMLKKALPYMEKAHELNPEDCGTMETLKTLYYRTQKTEQYEAISARIEEECVSGESTNGGL